MIAKIILNINHSAVRIAVINKIMEIPNVYDADGVDTSLSLFEGFKITHSLSTRHVDLDTGLVELASFDAFDVTNKVEKSAIPDFLLSINESDWFVDEKKETVQKLVFPKPKEVIKNEVIVNNKPTLSSSIVTFIIIALFASLITYFFNNDKFTLSYLGPMIPVFIISTGIGHYLSISKYNKAESELKKQGDVSSDLSNSITK
jgi:hypothetical protein